MILNQNPEKIQICCLNITYVNKDRSKRVTIQTLLENIKPFMDIIPNNKNVLYGNTYGVTYT